MLYIIGLGLYDEKDISVRGMEALKNCQKAYAEFYTNAFHGKLENLRGEIKILSREDVEGKAGFIKEAKNKDVAFLVPGDPMAATTHVDILLRAKKLGVETRIIHSSSVFSAIGETGLQIYKFGKTTSVVFPEKNYFPQTPYDVLKENLNAGLHTLLLLDVKADEERYMSVGDGIGILLEIEKKRKENVFTEETMCIGAARLGGGSAIKYARAKDLADFDFGPPPHAIVVPGKLHFVEEEFLDHLK